jgi:hypothetical protein
VVTVLDRDGVGYARPRQGDGTLDRVLILLVAPLSVPLVEAGNGVLVPQRRARDLARTWMREGGAARAGWVGQQTVNVACCATGKPRIVSALDASLVVWPEGDAIVGAMEVSETLRIKQHRAR